MKVIINADDFGYDSDTVKSTIDAFIRGTITSATIMPNMPGTAEAIRFAKDHPQFSFGVHLTYSRTTCERPICSNHASQGLTDITGSFKTANDLRSLALIGRISKIDIELETIAQIERMMTSGVHISHVDSHGHLHKFPVFQSVLRDILPRFSLRRVRAVQNVFFGPRVLRPTSWFSGTWGRMISDSFITTSHMYMPAGIFDLRWSSRLLEVIPRDACIEVGVHPGMAEPWRLLQIIEADKFVSTCRHVSVDLATWNDIT